jgi:hypothetical protein
VSISAGLCLLGPFQELVTGENTHQLSWLISRDVNTFCHALAKKILKLSGNFRLLAKCNPRKGNSVMLWQDNWAVEPLQFKYPQLFSFTRKPKLMLHQILFN